MLACACMLMLVASCLFLLAGCKDSKAIKNIIHDQNAETVDSEGGETFRIVSKEGRFTSEDTGLYEVAGGDVESLSVNVVYVSNDPETELPSARFVYDENSENSTEASEGVNIAPPQDQQQQQDQQTEPEQPERRAQGDEGAQPGDGNPDDEPDGDQEPEDDGEGPPEEPGVEPGEPEPAPPEPSGTGSDDANAPQVYDATGEDEDLPDAGSIAAYGQVAVLVQMLGGTSDEGGYTPLAAADDKLCASDFSRVFADEGADRINPAGFSANGSGGYIPDVDQIIESKPDTVLVFSDAMFSEADKARLAQNGVNIAIVPALTSDTGIMRAAKNIAKMLDKETEGRSTSVYERYKQFHDSLIAEVEGDRGYGAYDGRVYDAYMNKRPNIFMAQRFTLVVDSWDYGAKFAYGSAISDAGAGVGLATVGYLGSPVSYYLGVAGVVNNAAAIDVTKPGAGLLAPAWQFNPTDLSPSEIDFSSGGFSSRLYANWGTGFTKTTLSRVNTKKLTLREAGLGTDIFPTVIVATAKMRDKFLLSANSPNGLYHPFGSARTDVGTIPGTLSGRTPVFTVIDENLDTTATTKAVVVNPHGLFSSWLEGSAESFLECAWAANVEGFSNEWGGSAASEIKAFYESFYRYDIADGEIQDILDGLSE